MKNALLLIATTLPLFSMNTGLANSMSQQVQQLRRLLRVSLYWLIQGILRCWKNSMPMRF